jgi:hypothetical protein
MRIIAAILVFLSLSSASAFATSIVAIRDGDEIVIGADSKTTLLPGSGAAAAGSIAKCKIIQAGNLFFASAGSAGIGPASVPGDIYPEFDLSGIIAKGLQGSGRIADKVRNLETVLAANLTRIAEKARKEDAAFFLTRFLRRTIDTIIIGGIEDGQPVLMVRSFRLISSPGGGLSFDIGRFSCPGDCQEPATTIFEGRSGAIRTYLQQHKLFLQFADPVTAVRDLVGLEISEDPSSVGPPIDILRLTRRGAEWVQRKSICPDIQGYPLLPTGESGRGLSVAGATSASCGE